MSYKHKEGMGSLFPNKYKEKDKMSLKEWKNNELNKQLLKKFGILKENKKPDFPDVDGDGDREEPISKAQKDKKAKGGDEKKSSKPKKGEVPPQLQKHIKGKKDDEEDKEEIEESTSSRHSDADRRQSKDREYADRLREGEEDDRLAPSGYPKQPVFDDRFATSDDLGTVFDTLEYTPAFVLPDPKERDKHPKTGEYLPKKGKKLGSSAADMRKFSEAKDDVKDKDSENKKYNFDKKDDDAKEKENTLQESIKRIARAKRVFLNGKRVK